MNEKRGPTGAARWLAVAVVLAPWGLIAAVGMSACGSTAESNGAGGSSPGAGGSAGASTSSVSSSNAGTGGAGVCGVGQVRVVPCCGGAPPPCEPLPEGGVCPPTQMPTECNGVPGCQALALCDPLPPYCTDSSKVDCSGTSCHTTDNNCSGTLMGTTLACECA